MLLLWPGIATGLLAAAIAFALARFLVPRLPEPEPEAGDDFVKPLYRELVGPRMVLPAVALGLAGGVLAPLTGGMVWATVALAGAGAALVVVDAHTTYLPWPLHLLTLALVVLGGGIDLLAGADRGWAPTLLGAGFGAVASHALFWLVWRLGNGLGYGDVRLAAVVGAVSGAMGVQFWWHSLLAASIVGALAGLLIAAWRRRHPSALGTAFAYGPALWAGPFLVLVLG